MASLPRAEDSDGIATIVAGRKYFSATRAGQIAADLRGEHGERIALARNGADLPERALVILGRDHRP